MHVLQYVYAIVFTHVRGVGGIVVLLRHACPLYLRHYHFCFCSIDAMFSPPCLLKRAARARTLTPTPLSLKQWIRAHARQVDDGM